MDINQVGSQPLDPNRVNRLKQEETKLINDQSKQSGSKPQGDSVSLSKAAEEQIKFTKLAEQTESPTASRVSEIKEAIASGEYMKDIDAKIDSAATAISQQILFGR